MGIFRRLFNQSETDENANKANKVDTPQSIGPEDSSLHPEASTAPLKPESPVDEVMEISIDDTPSEPEEDDITLGVTRPLREEIFTFADGATRPLPLESVISAVNEHITFGISTDTGMVRNNNQDSAYTFFSTTQSVDKRPDFGVFVVADGMGGHFHGEQASAMTVQIVASQVMSSIYLPMLTGKNDSEQKPITEALIEAVQKANAEVIAHIPEGGTTLTAAIIIGSMVYLAHVGDSRAYLITREDGAEQLTRDHSWVQRMIELNQLTPDEANEHPQKNVLYRALGQSEALEVDPITRRLPANSKLLMCSDGLWNMIEEKALVETVLTHQGSPQNICDKLVSMANANGGADNITVILLEVPGRK